MKIGNIKGNVMSAGYKNWVHLDSLSLSVTRQFTTQPGQVQGRESSHPSFSAMTVSKKLDSASLPLFQLACEGREGQTVIIHLCHTGILPMHAFMVYTLNNALVGQYHIQQDNKGIPYEEIILHYDKIEMKFTPMDASNKPETNIVAGYDLRIAQSI